MAMIDVKGLFKRSRFFQSEFRGNLNAVIAQLEQKVSEEQKDDNRQEKIEKEEVKVSKRKKTQQKKQEKTVLNLNEIKNGLT